MAGRRKVFERVKWSRSDHIRDLLWRIVLEVFRYRFIRGSQLRRLLWPRPSQRSHGDNTLREAFDRSLVDRQPELQPTGRPSVVYSPGAAGRVHLERELEVPASKLRPRPAKERRRSQLFLAHHLSLVDVLIATRLAVEGVPGEIAEHLDELALRRIHASNPSDLPVIPDAFLELAIDDQRQTFFIELDRATASTRRWEQRISDYALFSRQDSFQARFGSPAILIVVDAPAGTARRRLVSLKRLIDKTNETRGADRTMFWLALHSDVNSESFLGEPIWAVGGLEGAHSLRRNKRSSHEIGRAENPVCTTKT